MTLDNFTFKKVEGGYGLVRYTGKETIVVVPATVQGEPVVEILEGAFWESNSIIELNLPDTLRKVEGKSIGPCRCLRKVTCFSKVAEFDLNCFYISHELEEMTLSIWEQVWLFRDENEPILQNYRKQWDVLLSEEKKRIISRVSAESRMKEYLFTEGDTELMSFLLREGVEVTLDELNDFLKINIKKNNTIATALLLHYKGSRYTKEQREVYEQHREMMELGLEPPTFEEFDRKWWGEEVDGRLEILRYLGDDFEARMPSVLADGRTILKTQHNLNGAYEPLKKLILEEGIEHLVAETFSRSETLEEIILPETLEFIGDDCFSYCESLKSIKIPSQIKELPQNCFSDCLALESISLPEGLVSIGDYSFFKCTNLKEIKLPQSLKEFKQGSRHYVNAFCYTTECGVFCGSGIESITIPLGVTKITDYAFYACSHLKEVNLHDNITDIGSGAFKFARLLADEQGFVIINNILFDYVGEENCCVVPDFVRRISLEAFYKSDVERIVLPQGLTEIESGAFVECNQLKEIIIPNSVKILPKNAFNKCEALEKVIISSSTLVEEGAVENCPQCNITT